MFKIGKFRSFRSNIKIRVFLQSVRIISSLLNATKGDLVSSCFARRHLQVPPSHLRMDGAQRLEGAFIETKGIQECPESHVRLGYSQTLRIFVNALSPMEDVSKCSQSHLRLGGLHSN